MEMMEILANGAAVAASFFFALGGYYYADPVKKIGSYNVNAIRILFYLIGVSIIYLLIFGPGFPNANPAQWLYLGLSAFFGLVFGDFLFFVALKHITPRLTFLIASSIAPIVSALVGFLFLGEKLAMKDIAGILIVLAGILIVLSKNGKEDSFSAANSRKIYGIVIAVICAVGQGLSMVFTKIGIMGGIKTIPKPLDPFAASVIRTIYGAVIIWGIAMITGKAKTIFHSMKDKTSLKATIIGAVAAVIAIWLLLFALTHAKVGIAVTLGNMMPIMIILIMFIMKREKTGARGIVGSTISIAGVAVLMLS
jgi:drug/metabolite transporter (DMT)-like permease